MASSVRAAVAIFIAIWFGWFFYHPIDLLPADLGRHIMNGRILLNEPGQIGALLHTNYYSLPAPNAAFINHHWLTGVVFFLVWHYSGFVGINFFHLAVNLIVFLLFFRLAVKRGGFGAASLTALLLLPLIAERTEVRPEIFTYLGVALTLTVLEAVVYGRSRPWRLLWLLPIQLFWVNLHIYFFLGPFFVGAYWLAALFKKLPRPNLIVPLGLTLLGTLAVCLINPSQLNGLLYPLLIFKQYDFHVSENQSVLYFEANGIKFSNLLLFKIAAVLLIVHYCKLWFLEKKLGRLEEIVIALLVCFWGYWAIRNFTLFGYIAWVALSGLLADSYREFKLPYQKEWLYYAGTATALLFFTVGLAHGRFQFMSNNLGAGLVAHSTDAFAFINDHRLDGPMFNDYDIGSAATFYLFPRLRPFVDNRPEAYPPGFWQHEFLPLHTNDKLWQALSQKYGFNLILFSMEDQAPWSKTFLEARLKDPSWAAVFKNDYALVLAKRGGPNQAAIDQYAIPRDKITLPWDKKI